MYMRMHRVMTVPPIAPMMFMNITHSIMMMTAASCCSSQRRLPVGRVANADPIQCPPRPPPPSRWDASAEY